MLFNVFAFESPPLETDLFFAGKAWPSPVHDNIETTTLGKHHGSMFVAMKPKSPHMLYREQ